MAEILPFRGIRYDLDLVGRDLAEVVAPPYDVISPAEQAALYERHPNNVVRLILGREPDRYARAAATFQQWRTGGILVADEMPAVYVYRQSFDDPLTGRAAPERTGLVCLLKLEDYSTGRVLPHENTLSEAKADRLELLKATAAQFESIFGLYADPDRAVQSFLHEYDDREPVIERVDGVIESSHSVERIRDLSAILALQELLRDKPIFIADGHHRYETALAYRRAVRDRQPDLSPESPIAADYILITLTAFEEEGLIVLPTHRLIRGVDPEQVLGLPAALHPPFVVSSVAREGVEAAIADHAGRGRVAFGLLLPGDRCYLAALDAAPGDLAALVPGPQSAAVKRLPVTLLGHLILERHLGIDANALAAGKQVGYTRDVDDAVRRLESGEYQAALLLGRPSVDDVRAVSLAGDTMPQKSTFFFPKLLSGLLMRDFGIDDLEVFNLDGE